MHDLPQEFLILQPRHQYQEQEPAGRHAGCSDIVTGYVNGQPANLPDSADDGIHVGDQDITADPGQGYVFPESSAKDDIRVCGPGIRKDPSLQDI
jgi:hypothetical protein